MEVYIMSKQISYLKNVLIDIFSEIEKEEESIACMPSYCPSPLNL